MSRARTLMGGPNGAQLLDQLRGLLEPRGWFKDVPDAAEPQPMVVVDGADIVEQADTLAWLSAVAASSCRTWQHTYWQVAPAGGDAGRVAQTAMALSEMRTAVQVAAADPAGTSPAVWMDGALVTPLVSVAANMRVLADLDQGGRAMLQVLDDLDAETVLADYTAAAAAGRIAALPKQDTRSGYTALWGKAAAATGLTDLAGFLAGRRDRQVITPLLGAEQMTAPRPETVVSVAEPPRIPAGAASDTRQWVKVVQDMVEAWAQTVAPVGFYVAAASLPGHPIKVEFQPRPDTPPGTDAARLAATVVSQTAGPWMREPYPQYSVDGWCKQLVQDTQAGLLSAARTHLGGDSAWAVARYRTA